MGYRSSSPSGVSSILGAICCIGLMLMSVVTHIEPVDGFGIKKIFRFGKKTTLPRIDANEHVNGHTMQEVVPDKDIKNIFANNQEWKRQKLAEDPEFFSKLGSGHSPTYLWIGCADARVPANEIMGEDAGSVFVVRNVANLVVNTDVNLMAALQFAVTVLKVPHILVCGHYDCGGVRASMQNEDHVPPLENWLRNIRDVYRLHQRELDAIRDPERRHRRLVELNTIEQCLNLFKTGVIQRQRVQTYRDGAEFTTPRIHACVFDPKTGDMNRLPVNFKQYIDELHGIYDLYTPADEEKDSMARLEETIEAFKK